jgi:hypothetical protein
MSSGLCLEAAHPNATTQSPITQSEPTLLRQRVQMRSLDNVPAADGAMMLSDVRITVTGTNGIANAVINEVRLYEHDGAQPFPAKRGE